MARTGRRPGNTDTREAILTAARTAFAERGFDGASIRAIAASAGVDPALVHHYFGTKDQLFITAIELPIDPQKFIPGVATGDPDQIGERIVRTVLGVWDSSTGARAAAMIRSAVQKEWTARLFREFILTQVMRRVGKELGLDPEQTRIRIPLAVSQVLGLVVARYIIQLPPLSTMESEALVQLVGPTIQRYLTGPLGDVPQRTV
jgi:AcrR family transcriptional regulator